MYYKYVYSELFALAERDLNCAVGVREKKNFFEIKEVNLINSTKLFI